MAFNHGHLNAGAKAKLVGYGCPNYATAYDYDSFQNLALLKGGHQAQEAVKVV
jgi:hypothetical protein